MRRELESKSGVVRDLRVLMDHGAKDSSAERAIDEQARRELLRAQGAFMKAQAEGRIPADAKFPYEEFSRGVGPSALPDTKPMKKHRSRGSDLVPVASLFILGWGVELLLPRRFLDFFRRPFRRLMGIG